MDVNKRKKNYLQFSLQKNKVDSLVTTHLQLPLGASFSFSLSFKKNSVWSAIFKELKRYFRFKKNNTCVTDFKNKSVLEACSKNLSFICFILLSPNSSPPFKHSDDRGMRIMVESDDDHGIFWPKNRGWNWSWNRSVKLVPETTALRKLLIFSYQDPTV